MATNVVDRQREGVNCILDGVIYQRGQIMSWTLARKRTLFDTLGVGMVVNFWPKADSDMSACDDIVYLYYPTPHSVGMVDKDKELLADYVASWLRFTNKSVLIMCEAGKTRSVFFSTLVLAKYSNVSTIKAWETVLKRVRTHAVKDFMIEYIYAKRLA